MPYKYNMGDQSDYDGYAWPYSADIFGTLYTAERTGYISRIKLKIRVETVPIPYENYIQVGVYRPGEPPVLLAASEKRYISYDEAIFIDGWMYLYLSELYPIHEGREYMLAVMNTGLASPLVYSQSSPGRAGYYYVGGEWYAPIDYDMAIYAEYLEHPVVDEEGNEDGIATRATAGMSATGVVGDSLEFDGVGDIINFPDSVAINLNGEEQVSWEFWAYPEKLVGE